MSGARELDLGAVAVTCTFNPGTLRVGGVALDVPPTLITDEHYYEVHFDIPTNHPKMMYVRAMRNADTIGGTYGRTYPTQVRVDGVMTAACFYWHAPIALPDGGIRFSLRALRVEVARQPTP